MPAPAAIVAICVVSAVGAVAAGAAFHHFVYEPHIAPNLELWAENFVAKREARRRQRKHQRSPIAVYNAKDDDGHTEGTELEKLVSKEVDEWRSEVDRSYTDSNRSGLRHRNKPSAVITNKSSKDSVRYKPSSPSQILFDSSTPFARPRSLERNMTDGGIVPGRLPTPDSSRRSSPVSRAVQLPSPDGRQQESMFSSTDLEVLSAASSTGEWAQSPTPSGSHVHVEVETSSNLSPFEDNDLGLSPPAQLPRSETSLSDLELLSASSVSRGDLTEDGMSFDDDFEDVRSLSSWASGGMR